jgi:hypothetical protein
MLNVSFRGAAGLSGRSRNQGLSRRRPEIKADKVRYRYQRNPKTGEQNGFAKAMFGRPDASIANPEIESFFKRSLIPAPLSGGRIMVSS